MSSKRKRAVDHPQAPVRLTFVITAEMARRLFADAEEARTSSQGILKSANRSEIVRRVIGTHYKIPVSRWEPSTTPTQPEVAG